MDKNTITGFILIALVVIGFSWYSQPSKEELEAMAQRDSIAAVERQKQAEAKETEAAVVAASPATPDSSALFFSQSAGEGQRVDVHDFHPVFQEQFDRVQQQRLFVDQHQALRYVPVFRGDPASDAMRILESIRRDLTALDVPGISVDTESRGNSLFTTIRLESAGMFDMSVTKTDGLFELFLMHGEPSSEDDGPVFLRFEFFCE